MTPWLKALVLLIIATSVGYILGGRTGMAEIERLKEEAGENGPELVAALRARIKHLEALTPRSTTPADDHSKE
jgi:hypothetical protein